MATSAEHQKLMERNLHDLLLGLDAAHKADIIAYASGHLNESNLAKHRPDRSFKSPWKQTKKPVPKLPTSDANSATHSQKQHDPMKGTLANFSLGTSGALPAGKRPKEPCRRTGTKGPVKLQPQNKPVASAGVYTKTDDGVLVEELQYGELMLANSRYSRPKAWVEEDLKDDENYDMSAVSQSLIKDKNLAKMKHVFVPTYHAGITKKDQYAGFKSFEDKIIRKQDATEQHVLSGVKAVEHLENKLQQGLEKLQYQGYGPNFHRLQLYSDIFDDLNDHSPTFGFILRTIKKEYDDYVASLLDTQGGKHKVLYEQVENMSQRQGANPRILAREQWNVSSMSNKTKALIEENDRLRKELQDELERASQPEQEETEPARPIYGVSNSTKDAVPELSEQINDMHVHILDKLDEIQHLRQSLRTDFVPSTVVSHLEQCIKETEIELQKLQSQKEYFARSTGELEAEMKAAIEQADTTERDSRRVWKRIDAVKRLGQTNGVLQDSDDEEEEYKWNWYIS